MLSSRREFLRQTSQGFGMLAFSSMLARSGHAAQQPHHAPCAKHVIFCFMDGGPSHVDTFDYKPQLKKQEGKAIGKENVSILSQSTASRVWFGSPWKFSQRGESGLWVSDLLPGIASIADELCVVRSLVGKQPLHGQQALLMHTGRETGRAPSFGSWVSYGLGSENENLPGYVLLNNDWIPNGGFENFSSAYLPANHGAMMVRAKGTPVDNIVPQDKLAIQRRKLDLLQLQDRSFARQVANETAIESAILNHEKAFLMQSSIPGIADVSGETEQTRKMYGLDSKDEYKRHYSLQCLRARRLVERGVRFIEITCPLTHANNSPWDQHGNLVKYHNQNAMITDQGVTALILDLKQRGLLDETIVVWAGEMGRTPHTPRISAGAGRDHHVNGYSLFIAGGGFQGGTAYGQTDEFGNAAVENQLMIQDIHATILHQLGLDHEQLTFRFGGRDVSLTDVHGHVVKPLLSS
ncbi:MAG: DUF1501 domain-containing protein [Pirellulaceae bacterium]